MGSYQEELCLCDWTFRARRNTIDKRICTALHTEYKKGTSAVNKKTQKQLAEYFDGERKEFDISLLLIGTDFQKEVWTHLQKIPFGSKKSYLSLAKDMGNPGAVRAVAAANGANAISILVPCHRIVGQNGSMLGYAGGITAKKKLIALESGASQLTLF